MTDRLILGNSRILQRVIETYEAQPGTLRIGTENERLASRLHESGYHVETVSLTDSDALKQFGERDIVFLISGGQLETQTVAEAVRASFPDAYLLVYDSEHDPTEQRELEEIVDSICSPREEIAEYVLSRSGETGWRLRQLWAILRETERLAVLTHDNPDPDAIASGVALARIAEWFGCESTVCYYGNITHQENRAFVNVLDLDLRRLEPDDDVTAFDSIALVDHSRPGVNDQLPEETAIDIVVDHHPPRLPVDARFVDLRSDVGATSTLLAGYFTYLGIPVDEDIATALLFGIHVDTNSFSREVSETDFEAAAMLVESANLSVFERIESPSISGRTLDTIARAFKNRRRDGDVVLSSVGKLSERDALSQAADKLLTLEEIQTTLVYGIAEGTIYISARSRDPDIDIGEVLREAFDRVGSAGGHADMAGGQLPLGILESVADDDRSLEQIVESVIGDRFLDVIKSSPTTSTKATYAPTFEPGEEFVVNPSSEPSEDSN